MSIGKLTPKQVCECVKSVYFEGYNDGAVGRGNHLDETNWQIITDKLNKIVDECEMITLIRYDGSDPHYKCRVCGHENYEDYMPRFCPNCGRAVRHV